MKHLLPPSVFNWVTFLGAVVAIISLFMIGFLFVVTAVLGQGGSYLGLIIYIILPGIMGFGLVLIPIGMVITIRKEKKLGLRPRKEWPVIDLNTKKHWNAFLIFSVGSTFLLFVSSIGSYEAFNYTESVEFCGELCHTVMSPEYTAYKNSSHERVKCVECHVGTGVDWYIRSKLSGLNQIYKVLTETYPTPIETPIHDLRPARETCEHCHWPEKFYPQKLIEHQYYLSDEENSEWVLGLKMKVGSTRLSKSLEEGIHWHINPKIKIEYAATDYKRQNIKWVRYTNIETGEINIYSDENNELEEGELDTLEIRTMDCMDCHNRPSHSYKSPSRMLNKLFSTNKISTAIPDFKGNLMALLSRKFATKDSLKMALNMEMVNTYKEDYSDFYESNSAILKSSLTEVETEILKNIFPQMKVDWREYPNYIGHLEYPGCNRCHNDRFVSDKERTITRDCEVCHSITLQGPVNEIVYSSGKEGLQFKHPVDIEEAWKEMLCSECHTGGAQ